MISLSGWTLFTGGASFFWHDAITMSAESKKYSFIE
jgi:hypothetical protein